MFNIIIKVVFFIIGKIGDLILSPILLVVNTLLPDISVDFDAIFDYLQLGFQYIPFFLKALMIPPPLIQMLVLITTAYISITVGLRAYRFIMKLYTKFKP